MLLMLACSCWLTLWIPCVSASRLKCIESHNRLGRALLTDILLRRAKSSGGSIGPGAKSRGDLADGRLKGWPVPLMRA